MTDATWLVMWLAVLGVGVSGVVVLHRLGLRATYARDLLHVGTGLWVLGWPAWREPAFPIALVLGAAAATALVPVASRRLALAARFERSVTGGDERFGGLVLYALAYAVLTGIGVTHAPFPAAAAALALSLGDGVGGAVGRRFGRLRYTAPGAKRKSLEGSVAVAVMASAGAGLAAVWFDAPVGLGVVVALGITAAIAEALAPRGTDNVVVPGAVWLVARWLV